MKLLVRSLSVDSREPFAVLHRNDCLSIGVDVEDRVRIGGRHSAVLPIMMSDQPSMDGSVFVSQSVMERFGLTEGEMADVVYSPPPESIIAIKKKIDGLELDGEEIGSIVSDINEGLLTEREILSFVSAFNVSNASITEVADLTRAMASTGTTVDFGTEEVFDFHSLGGIPGNKITPIVVSIVASKGIVIPKLSSRAISSACGTSDFVETFCDVELGPDRLKDIIATTGGVFACGNTEYAPVGKEIIRAERPMGIDPRPMMLASIMSKKVALGVKDLLIDIPLGAGSKIQNMDVAEGFSDDLIALGNELGIRLECVVTNAEQPIGRTIGPVLEAWECIKALEDGKGDETLIEKACSMA
ncbi:MAG: thymidine phosphorylase, partial [Candidatus Methanomethylophilaceae archaeon]|nr:thymidine phosphorylase [Candidatus Methanomethylophilaceae archaeon]